MFELVTLNNIINWNKITELLTRKNENNKIFELLTLNEKVK